MTKYLLNTTVCYRVSTIDDALALRDELQDIPGADLVNFAYATKYIKEKGEIVDEYQVVKAKLEFNSEKDPEDCMIDATFDRGEF